MNSYEMRRSQREQVQIRNKKVELKVKKIVQE